MKISNLLFLLFIVIFSTSAFTQNVCIDKYLEEVNQNSGQSLAIVGSSKWENGKTLKVFFMGGSTYVQNKVIQYAKEWEKYANIKFDFNGTQDNSEIRISFDQSDGSWSYLGNQALEVQKHKATMNFGWFNQSTSENSFKGTTLHEFGHALGCIHEHQHPENQIKWNKPVVRAYYLNPPNRWSPEKVEYNIFRKYSVTQFSAMCPYDNRSIMHYHIPPEHTEDGYSVGWNEELSKWDKIYIEELYPFEKSKNRFWSDAFINFDKGGWVVGDYNGDKKDDVLRYGVLSPNSVEVFLSNNHKFEYSGIWQELSIDFNKGGIIVGDFGGDDKDDFLRYGIKNGNEIEVFISNGTEFRKSPKSWQGLDIDFNKGGIVVGDFGGDDKDDFLRYGIKNGNEIEVFISNGTEFRKSPKSWQGLDIDFNKGGIVVGDFDGNGKDDFLRYGIKAPYSVEVFLSNEQEFIYAGDWIGPKLNFNKGGIKIGKFNNDKKSDFFRFRENVSTAEMFFSTGSEFLTGDECN